MLSMWERVQLEDTKKESEGEGEWERKGSNAHNILRWE